MSSLLIFTTCSFIWWLFLSWWFLGRMDGLGALHSELYPIPWWRQSSHHESQKRKEKVLYSFNLFIMSLLSDSVQIHCQLLAEPSVLRMTSLNGYRMKMLSWIHLPVRVRLTPLAKRAPMMMESHHGVQKTVSWQSGLNGVHVVQHAYHPL